ncbi:MAG: glutamate ABC transporter substrate-binding protein [Lapillicoccus sp.]
MKLGRISAATVAALAAIGLAACGSGTPAGSSAGGGGGATGGGAAEAVKVGIKFDQPGMGLKEGSTYSGFDVDVANYIAKELNYTPTFVEAVSSQRETLIKTGQVKYIVGTYSITDARKKDVDFAGPYFIAGQDLLIRADDSSITGTDSLNGKKLCSVKGSTSAVNVQKKVPGVNLQEYNTYTLCVDALKAKSVDALTTDNAILAGYAAQAANKGKLKVVGQTFSTEKYGVGLQKGDTALCQKITDALKKFISSGEWQKSVDKNLAPAGFKPGAGNPPTPAACGSSGGATG